MELLPTNAALIVVNVQKAFDHPSWGERNNLGAEENIAQLIKAWRTSALPIFHAHHHYQSPVGLFRPTQPGFSPKHEAEPQSGEPIIYKRVNSAFIGTDLESRLRNASIQTLVIVGLTTDHCVSTTTRMAGNLGFDTYLVSDATATFERVGPNSVRYTAQQMHDTALASLHEEFAHIVSTRDVLDSLESVPAAWIRGHWSDHGS